MKKKLRSSLFFVTIIKRLWPIIYGRNGLFMKRNQEIYISKEESSRQKDFLEAILREWSTPFVAENLRSPMYFLETYGCQMNERDSLHLKGMLEQAGWIETSERNAADFVLYNTCCVREHAEAKVFGNVGSLYKRKRDNDRFLVGVCGCMMQQQETARSLYQRYPFVDIVFGTHALHRFPELFYQALMQQTRVFDVEENEGQIAEAMPTKDTEGVSAFVTIMYGCNNYCSYCIVPFVRGRERSRAPEDIQMEILRLVDRGVKDITLLGQNVNSYGLDMEDGMSFAQLLHFVQEIDGVERIRFMSSHPKDLSDELIEAMAQCDKVCNHLHLPVQSGSNAILKKMNRNYTREQYINRVQALRAAVPDIELTTDIIVGFPGETDQDFEDTLNLIREVGFSTAYTFMYSPRKGTVAADWPNQVEETVKKERLLRLNEIQNAITKANNEKYMGAVQPVLVERVRDNMGNGKTTTYKTVYFPCDESQLGQIVDVEIDGSKLTTLSGRMVRITE